MTNGPPSDSILQFRLARAKHFARQWRVNAKRLQGIANDPKIPDLVRRDALREASTAADIVAQRAADLTALAHARGYANWQADPMVGPLVVEVQSVGKALTHTVHSLDHR